MDKKKGRNLCAVRGCSVSYANLPEGVKLVGFPKDERLPKWVEAVKGEGSDWLPSKHNMICTLHFDRKYFKPDYLTRREWLLPGAIPSPAPQLPPACTIVQKLLPNSTAYVYRKKEGATSQGTILEDLTPTQQLQEQSNVERDTPVATKSHVSVLKNISDTPNSDACLASRTPVSRKRGVSVLRNIVNTIHNTPHKKMGSGKICTASSDSALCPNESPSANTMLIPLTPPVTPHHPASKVCESSAMISSTPSAAHSGASLDGPNCSVSPCLSTPSRKRSAFPADISETPSKAVVLSGAPVTINLDIEEDDSPRKIILKQMIMDLEKKLENEKKEKQKQKKQTEYYKRRYEETRAELHAMKEIVRKVSLNMDTQDAVHIFRTQVPEDTYALLERIAGDIHGEYEPLIRSFALTIHFYSPPAYMFLRGKVNNKLPCDRTIRLWYSAVGGEPGFTDESLETIQHLSKESPKLPVALIVDDMKIRKHVQMVSDKLIGAVNYGGIIDTSSKKECVDQEVVAEEESVEDDPMVLDGEMPVDLLMEGGGENDEDRCDMMTIAEKAVPHATDACVFMVVFLTLHLKMPIGYFLHSGLNGMMLAILVRHALKRLYDAGVTVTALISDGLSTNFTMVNTLGGDTRVRLYRMPGQPPSMGGHVNWTNYTSMFPDPSDPSDTARLIAFMPDVCHMLKLVRNTLAIWGTMLDVDGNTIKWQYIVDLVNLQNETGLKFANKLGRVHVEWCRQKMKTKFAAQTLSNSVADALEYLEFTVGLRRFRGASATARFIRVFNDLFDVLNSKSKFGKGLKAPMTLRNEAVWKKIFRESEHYIKGLKMEHGEAVVNTLREKGFRGFLLAIRAAETLFDRLVRTGRMDYLLTYKFSQDAIEIFFGLIRQMGGFNSNPTAVQFTAAFKRLLFKNQLKASRNGNAFPFECIKVLSVKSKSSQKKTSASLEGVDYKEVEQYMRLYRLADLNICSDMCVDSVTSYLAGFVARQVFRTSTCLDCASALIATDPSTSGDVHGFIRKKSGGQIQSKVHPTLDVLSVCRLAERAIRCSQSKGVDLMKATKLKNAAAVHACNEAAGHVFKCLDSHVADLDPLEGHVLSLIKEIFVSYWDVRVHQLCRGYNDILQSGSRRQQYYKNIHFQNL